MIQEDFFDNFGFNEKNKKTTNEISEEVYFEKMKNVFSGEAEKEKGLNYQEFNFDCSWMDWEIEEGKKKSENLKFLKKYLC
eukprot:snap_masked-scaffold_14-processed-gene-4.19-mRNA-1 protein AED:1.00 eAED:1.00 QI:0/-1/0/0/-1/1/1/0/80